MERDRGISRNLIKLSLNGVLALTLASCGINTGSLTVGPDGTATSKATSREVATATEKATPSATATSSETATLTFTPTETEHPTTPKIMLLGDSIIKLGKIPTYLSEDLAASGIRIDFVGDEMANGNTVPAEGHGGFDTTLMARELYQGTNWTELNGTQIPDNFSEHIPDIVIIQLGTNDALNASESGWNPVPIYEKYMKEIVDFLRSKNPNVKIVIPMLIPSGDKGCDAEVVKLNNDIPGFVAQLDTESSRVVTTKDLRADWKQDNFLDFYHPDTSGQQKIAKEEYFDTLVENNYLAP